MVAHFPPLSHISFPCPGCGAIDQPICPNCGTTRDLTSESETRIREKVRADNTQALAVEREQIRRQERERAEADAALERDDLRNHLAEAEARKAKLQKNELDLRRRERAVQTKLEEDELRRQRAEDER